MFNGAFVNINTYMVMNLIITFAEALLVLVV